VTTGDQRAGRRWLAAWRIVRRLPEPVAMGLGAFGGYLYYRLDERRRAALRVNMRQVLGPDASQATVERVARRGFYRYGRYWAEAFRLEDLSQEDIRDRFRIEGQENLDAATARGRGAIFAVPHIGNWDAGAAWLLTQGYQVTTIAERLKPEVLFDRFLEYRRALGMEILPLDNGSESMRGVLRALRAGRVVALVCDRDLTGHGLPVEMFGSLAAMPGGPASLAIKTGAALLPSAVLQDRRGGRWVGVIRPEITVEPSGDPRADAQLLTQRLAKEFEGFIARHPEQWHVLSRFWRGIPVDAEPSVAEEVDAALRTAGAPAPSPAPGSSETTPLPPPGVAGVDPAEAIVERGHETPTNGDSPGPAEAERAPAERSAPAGEATP
jgi:phosphatidylinositol dimannoside acyltransferase